MDSRVPIISKDQPTKIQTNNCSDWRNPCSKLLMARLWPLCCKPEMFESLWFPKIGDPNVVP